MFKVTHVSIQEHHRHRLSDVSFAMGNCGFCSLYGDDEQTMELFAYALAGFYPFSQGSITCDDFVLSSFDETQRSLYRSQYVTSWIADAYLLPAKTVKENICLAYTYSEDDLQDVLTQYELSDVQNVKIESLTFQQRIATFLAKITIRHYHTLIFYPKSMPYSRDELEIIYQWLKKCSKKMLIIVIQDKECNRYADRCMAFLQGLLISDDQTMKHVDKEQKQAHVALTVRDWKKILKQARYPQLWVYAIFYLHMILAFLCISLTFMITTLPYVDLQMDLLKANQSDTFAIHKIAKGKDGTLYPYERAILNSEDEKQLSHALQGNLLKSYEPINKSFANAYLSGAYKESEYPIYNAYPVLEAKSQENAQIHHLYGHYPTSYQEVVLPLSLAEKFFDKRDAIDEYLNEHFHWYGLECVVSGVFKDADGGIKEPCIYVFDGYINHHHLAKMNSFLTSYKRMVFQDDFYQVKDIQPVKAISRYFDGEKILEEQKIPSNGVILDYYAAEALGFQLSETDQQEASYQERLISYFRFASNLIGKTIRIQFYDVEIDPLNSMLFSKEVKIEGFLIPNMDTLNYYHPKAQAPMLFVNEEEAKDILVKNIQLHNIYYQGNSPQQIHQDLEYLNQSDHYEAVMAHSLVLKLMVQDGKEIRFFFIAISILFVLISNGLYLVLIRKMINNMHAESANYIRFGENIQTMRQSYHAICMQSYFMASLSGFILSVAIIISYLTFLHYRLGSCISIYQYIFILLCPCLLMLIQNLILSFYLKQKLARKLTSKDAYQSKI